MWIGRSESVTDRERGSEIERQREREKERERQKEREREREKGDIPLSESSISDFPLFMTYSITVCFHPSFLSYSVLFSISFSISQAFDVYQ